MHRLKGQAWRMQRVSYVGSSLLHATWTWKFRLSSPRLSVWPRWSLFFPAPLPLPYQLLLQKPWPFVQALIWLLTFSSQCSLLSRICNRSFMLSLGHLHFNDWSTTPFLHHLHFLLPSFSSISWFWISRNADRAADCLVSLAYKRILRLLRCSSPFSRVASLLSRWSIFRLSFQSSCFAPLPLVDIPPLLGSPKRNKTACWH